jgi:anti-sigma factor RsiW
MRDTSQHGELRCLAADELVAYVYDESDAGERAAVETHIATCPSCAAELASLRDTRTVLGTWTPPEIDLGFQITRPRVLTSPRWWAQPLPAWAQAAAAVAIFTSGMALGVAHRSAAPAAAPVVAQTVPAPAGAATAVTPVAAVTRQDLDAVARQLRDEIAEVRTVKATTPARASNDDVLRQVRTLIADSEQRQQRAFAVQTTNLARQLDAQRRLDVAQMQRAVGQIQDLTGAAVRDQNQLVNYLMNVSQRR